MDADNIFNCILLNENVWIPIKFHKIVLPRVQSTVFSGIGLDNGLVLARWQAIIWTSDGKLTDDYMCHLASMS